MAYTDPTVAEIKAKFPAFANIADATVDAAIAEAAGFVDQDEWREADYKPAISYLAAHLLTIGGALMSAASGAEGAATLLQSGIISEMRVDDVVVKSGVAQSQQPSRSGSGAAKSPLASTEFGKQFLEYSKRNIVPFRFV